MCLESFISRIKKKNYSTLNYVLKYLDLVRNKIFKFIRRQDMLNK